MVVQKERNTCKHMQTVLHNEFAVLKSVQGFDISYLSNRQQTIESEAGLADFAHVRYGVPQGSILGPTLFLLFINDLPLYFKHCSSALFADDATAHTHSKTVDTIENNLHSQCRMGQKNRPVGIS